MANKKILVTGGAGYIGSHAVLDLKRAGWEPYVFDNFDRGNRDIADKLGVKVVEGDLLNFSEINQAIKDEAPVAVMHFAALAQVGESVAKPDLYYENNVYGTLNLLKAMVANSVLKMVFSSTCAVYGEPEQMPMTEDLSRNPVNPYGYSKLCVEQMLADFDAAYGLKSIVFRYFNAAGADESGKIGEKHDPETHLIPLIIMAALNKTAIKVFGDDYDTPDGTCIRDYIHINDIAQAHILGIDYLIKNNTSNFFNIGNGKGYSVKEVIDEVERVTGIKVQREIIGRRAGDPPRLVASSEKLSRILGWKPQYPELSKIVETAWNWHR